MKRIKNSGNAGKKYMTITILIKSKESEKVNKKIIKQLKKHGFKTLVEYTTSNLVEDPNVRKVSKEQFTYLVNRGFIAEVLKERSCVFGIGTVIGGGNFITEMQEKSAKRLATLYNNQVVILDTRDLDNWNEDDVVRAIRRRVGDCV